MAIVSTNDENYKNIAAAIRSNSGSKEKYTPGEMPDAIEKVYNAGYVKGEADGYTAGNVEGFATGEESYRQYFWDVYQENGERTEYRYAFAGSGWTEGNFWPQYDIVIENGYQTFAYFAFNGSLKDRLAACKVALRFQGSPLLTNLFTFAQNLTELGVIDFGGVPANSNNTHLFKQCTALRTIEKLVFPVGQANWNSWFSGCGALENVVFSGTIVAGGLDLSDSPKLTRESILSLLNCLADKNGTSGTFKITLGATNLAKLTSEEKAIATGKGWILA